MYGSETESISTTAPWRSMTKSLGARVASKSKPYWKPEHPPPETLTRSAVPAGSAESRRAMRLAALSDKVTAPAVVSITSDKFGKALSFLVLTAPIVKSSSRSCQCRGALLHCSTSNYFDFRGLRIAIAKANWGNPICNRQASRFLRAVGRCGLARQVRA